ncbi:MAG: UbiA family prenyltransferase [Myxococcota bacterium]
MRELVWFFVHLRWHYQIFILSGGFLLGALFQPRLDFGSLTIQFLSVHLLLNGGLTAYNSFYDEDEGPVGGLESPPPMRPWMLPASLGVQLVGAGVASLEGPVFLALYGLTMGLSVLYSAPRFRWKGHPLLSLVAVGVGTGTNTFLMGYLSAGSLGLNPTVLIAALGVSAILLSLYPVSQVFQIEEDRARGDLTFAARYGLAGVRRFFLACYLLGLPLTVALLWTVRPWAALGLLLAGGLGGIASHLTLGRLRGAPDEYRIVMRLKLGASLSFVAFLVACLVGVGLAAGQVASAVNVSTP